MNDWHYGNNIKLTEDSNGKWVYLDPHEGEEKDCPVCHPKGDQTPPRHRAKLASNSLPDDSDCR